MLEKFEGIKIDKKDLLIFTTMFFVLVFIFIIIKSYNIAKTQNNLENLQVIEGSKGEIKVKGENPEIIVADNSFYNSFGENNKKDCLTIVLNNDNNKINDLSNVNSTDNENSDNKDIENNFPLNDVIELNNYNSEININDNKTDNKKENDADIKFSYKANSNFKIQLIALKDKRQALSFIERTKKLCGNLLKRLDIFILEVNLEEKGIFYRVQVSGFLTREEALDFCKEYGKINNNSTSCIVLK